MGDDDEEEEEKKPKFFLARIFSFGSLERFFVEILRLVVFAIIAFFIANYISNRNSRDIRVGVSNFQMFDPATNVEIMRDNPGLEWELDEIVVNTSDDLSSHFVKAVVVVSYDNQDEGILAKLANRSGEIQSGIREIIGSKPFLELKKVENQRIVAEEIKTKIQRIVGSSSIEEVFLKEFSVY